MDSTSLSDINGLGCNQANFDAANNANSLIFLGFGVQNTDNASTTFIFGSAGSVPYSTDEQLAESFAQGYASCGNGLHMVSLVVGTNNCNPSVNNGGGGNGWGIVVNAVNSYVTSAGIASQVQVMGGDDIESWGSSSGCPAIYPNDGSMSDGSGTTGWVQGFAAYAPSTSLLDYGSADGCSPSGSCNYGWDQYLYWYVSWGYGFDSAGPQIYYDSQSNEWAAISAYGSNSQGSTINFSVLVNEYDRDNSTFQPIDSWNSFWNWATYYGVQNAITNLYLTEVWVET